MSVLITGDGAAGHSILAALAGPAGTTAASPLPSLGPRRPTRAFGFQVRSDRDKFAIFLDVKHFSPEDLTVKVQEDFVEIHGKHSERQVSPEQWEGRPRAPDPGSSRRGCPVLSVAATQGGRALSPCRLSSLANAWSCPAPFRPPVCSKGWD